MNRALAGGGQPSELARAPSTTNVPITEEPLTETQTADNLVGFLAHDYQTILGLQDLLDSLVNTDTSAMSADELDAHNASIANARARLTSATDGALSTIDTQITLAQTAADNDADAPAAEQAMNLANLAYATAIKAELQALKALSDGETQAQTDDITATQLEADAEAAATTAATTQAAAEAAEAEVARVTSERDTLLRRATAAEESGDTALAAQYRSEADALDARLPALEASATAARTTADEAATASTDARAAAVEARETAVASAAAIAGLQATYDAAKEDTKTAGEARAIARFQYWDGRALHLTDAYANGQAGGTELADAQNRANSAISEWNYYGNIGRPPLSTAP